MLTYLFYCNTTPNKIMSINVISKVIFLHTHLGCFEQFIAGRATSLKQHCGNCGGTIQNVIAKISSQTCSQHSVVHFASITRDLVTTWDKTYRVLCGTPRCISIRSLVTCTKNIGSQTGRPLVPHVSCVIFVVCIM